MKLQIERSYVEAMVSKFPDLSALKEQLKFGNKAEIPFNQLSNNQLGFLRNLYESAGPQMLGRAAQIATLQQAVNDGGERYKLGDLEKMLPAVAEYFIKGGIRGWLFQANSAGKPLAFLVARIDFTPPGEEESGRILIDLKANAMAKIGSVTITILERDIGDKTIAEIFASKGFLKETPQLIANYDESTKRFFAWRANTGHQFSARGTGIYAEDPTASHRTTDWSRKNLVVLSSNGGAARLVNDEEILKDRALTLDHTSDILGKYLRKAGKSAR